jgi:deazaflavin-dependent oxidoreductase (nitroreductase family)
MPVIELTTTGRKSGQPRTATPTSPYQEDSTIIVVASRGGHDTNPAWFLNLRDNPNVMVKLRQHPPLRLPTPTSGREVGRLSPTPTATMRDISARQNERFRSYDPTGRGLIRPEATI